MDEPGAQEHIVVDVVHADGHRPHGDGGVVALEFDPGRFCRAGRKNAVDHDLAGGGFFKANSRRGKGQGLAARWWRESKGRGGSWGHSDGADLTVKAAALR